jgi:hypothetical protein
MADEKRPNPFEEMGRMKGESEEEVMAGIAIGLWLD